MMGTASTAPIPPHTENQNTRLSKMTTSFKPKPRRYTVGPNTSPTTNDPRAGMNRAHQRCASVRSGSRTMSGRGMIVAMKLPRLGMKKSQKETMATDPARLPGTPQA